jgi:hypothetical protein
MGAAASASARLAAAEGGLEELALLASHPRGRVCILLGKGLENILLKPAKREPVLWRVRQEGGGS